MSKGKPTVVLHYQAPLSGANLKNSFNDAIEAPLQLQVRFFLVHVAQACT